MAEYRRFRLIRKDRGYRTSQTHTSPILWLRSLAGGIENKFLESLHAIYPTAKETVHPECNARPQVCTTVHCAAKCLCRSAFTTFLFITDPTSVIHSFIVLHLKWG